MSSGLRISLDEATKLATELEHLLFAGCDGIVVAGSVRRRKETVGDLELVAKPRLVPDRQGGLFGPVGERSLLWDLVERLIEQDVGLERHPDLMVACGQCRGGAVGCPACAGTGRCARAAPWGQRYRKLRFRGLPVDLFTARPEAWGAQLLIRTGPSEFSQAWVAALRRRGLRMEGGLVLLDHDQVVNIPDERTAFEVVGWPLVAPQEREGHRGW